MGRAQLLGMLDAAPDEATVLRWHLQSNHYPPVPESMVPVAQEALRLARAGEWEGSVALPEGVLFRGETAAPVREVLEHMHLWDMVGEVEE